MKYRVVQRDLTLEIEVLSMLFDRYIPVKHDISQTAFIT